MTSILLLLASLAWGRAPPDEVAIARQQARVTELARIAAHARDSGAPRSAVTAAMRAYRIDAETLGHMREEAFVAAADALAAERAAAVGALGEALAHGRAAAPHRVTVEAWLGDLDAQLEILEAALADARVRPDSPLSTDLALDVGERAQVVALAASYDESRASSHARQLRLRAHALRSRASSGMSGGLDDVLEAKAHEVRAAELDEDVAHSHALAERAARVQRDALELVGENLAVRLEAESGSLNGAWVGGGLESWSYVPDPELSVLRVELRAGWRPPLGEVWRFELGARYALEAYPWSAGLNNSRGELTGAVGPTLGAVRLGLEGGYVRRDVFTHMPWSFQAGEGRILVATASTAGGVRASAPPRSSAQPRLHRRRGRCEPQLRARADVGWTRRSVDLNLAGCSSGPGRAMSRMQRGRSSLRSDSTRTTRTPCRPGGSSRTGSICPWRGFQRPSGRWASMGWVGSGRAIPARPARAWRPASTSRHAWSGRWREGSRCSEPRA